LISADWRQKWLAFLDNADAMEPPPLEPNVSLRCEHDCLKYNPAEYFEQINADNSKGRHPHEAAYVLVPMTEAEAIYNGGDKLSGPPNWCKLECRSAGDADHPQSRTYACSPRPCELCTGVNASYKLDVKIETEMKLCCKPSVNMSAGLQLDVRGETCGVEVKDLIVGAFGFKDVVPGQLLLSANGSSFGDCDTLKNALGKVAWNRHVPLTAEIYDFVMSEPAPKRRRASLLDSNLSGKSAQNGIQSDEPVEIH